MHLGTESHLSSLLGGASSPEHGEIHGHQGAWDVKLLKQRDGQHGVGLV